MPSLHHRLRSTPPHWIVALIFFGIALIGASVLRLYRLDLIDFRFDQAYPLQYAIDIVQGHLWAVQPHGSVAAHPPVYLYLMALPYLFTQNFMTIVTFRVMLDVAAVGLCWWIGTHYFNWRVGSIAALLYAVGPWAIQSARNTWPVPQPLFSAILAIGLLELVQRRNPWGWTISGVGFALCAGTHLAGAYLLPVALLGWWLGRKKFKWIPVILGALPMLILAGDYLLYDATHQFASIHALLGTFDKPAQFGSQALRYALWLSGGTHLSDLTGQAFNQWAAQTPALLTQIDTLQMYVLGFGILTTVVTIVLSLIRGRDFDAGTDRETSSTLGMLLILVWWLSPIVLQLRHSQPIVMQYLPATLPAPFLLMAFGADSVIQWARKTLNHGRVLRPFGVVVMLVTTVILIMIGAWQVATTLHLGAFVETFDTSGGYGLPVRSALRAVENAKQARASGIGGEVAVVIKDYMTPWNEPGLILHVLLADTPHRFLNSDVPGWIFRPEGTSYIFAPGTEALLQELYGFYGPSEVITSEVPIRDSLTSGFIYAQVKQMPDTAKLEQVKPARWDNGIELSGYRIITSATNIRVETLMHVLQNQPDNVDYHWYNHVFAGDVQVAQKDDSGIHPTSWRAGDYLLYRFDIPLSKPLPAAGTYVRIGCYSFPNVHGVQVTQEGRPADDGVNLPISPP